MKRTLHTLCCMLLLAATASAYAQAPDLLARIQNADLASSIDQAGLNPWHLKLSVQLYDPKGAPSEKGTVEQWWTAPDLESITYTFPSYTATMTRTKEGIFRTAGVGSPPYLVEYVRRQTVHPMPTGAELTQGKPDLRKETMGKMDFDCIMIDEPIKMVAYPPLGLFPTYCLERGKDTLRITSDFGTQVAIRAALGGFQGHTVPLDLAINSGTVHLATSHVDKLEGHAGPFPQASLTDGLVDQKARLARIGGGVMAGQIITKVQPVYPEAARLRRATGTVVFHAVIGTDGRVHSLKLLAVPDPDLAISAIAAVRQWTYKPYLLNGEPTDVDTTITVNYNMSP